MNKKHLIGLLLIVAISSVSIVYGGWWTSDPEPEPEVENKKILILIKGFVYRYVTVESTCYRYVTYAGYAPHETTRGWDEPMLNQWLSKSGGAGQIWIKENDLIELDMIYMVIDIESSFIVLREHTP